MANIKEQLLFTLNNLESEDLKLFQWYLKNGVEGFCCIPKAQLENTSRLITVDKMVQTYGSDGAVEITLAILEKMNYNQQAEELRTKIRGALKNHKLIKDHKLTSSQLKEKICSQHDKPIDIYCHTDQRFICYLCMMEEHRGHDTVTALSERHKKQSDLKEVQRKFLQRIQERERKVQDLKQAVDTLKRSAQAAVEDSERIFTELIRSIEKKRYEVRELIRNHEKEELSGAEGLLEQLEQEIADLKRRDTELEQLSHTKDHIHFLQSFQSLCVSSGSEDSPSISVQQSSFDGVKKYLSDLKEQVEEFCKEEFNKIPPHVDAEPKTREDFLKYYRRLTLDPNTANRHFILSEMNRVVTCSEKVQPYCDHPERFDWYQVLSKESVRRRCYWEVEWRGGGKVDISVSYKNISRKGGYDGVFGRNTQSWSLWCCPSSLSFFHGNIETEIPEPPPSRIGVYVDHSAGTLSFYRVSDTMTLLHTVHTTFTHSLCAGFGVGFYGSTVRLCDVK